MSARKSLSVRFSKLLHRGSKHHDDGSVDKARTGLCDVCSTIGFDDDGSDRKPVFSLGLLGDLQQRSSCPFCKLVLNSMQDERIIHMQPIDHYTTHEIRVLFESEVKGFDRIVSSSQIDFKMVKSWLETCEGEHKKYMYITPVPITSQYIALSYKWGECKPFLLLNVGCRYVWIDQLCLIQDDDDDRGTAYFTIIAESDMDADSGLPGVREETRSSSQQVTNEVLPSVNLVPRHTMQDIVAKSEYHHRGWTSDPTTEQGQALHKPSGDIYHLLGQLLNKYTTRELKEPTDYVFAIAGVCRRLADYAQCGLLFGIPIPALDWFLLFYPNKTGLRRRDGFPSWAWAGWYGQVYYNYGSGNVTKWTAASTWITWYKREPAGERTMLCDNAGDRGLKANELFGHLCNMSRTETSKNLLSEPIDKPYSVLQFWTISASFSLRKIDQEEGEKLMWDKDGTSCGFVTLDNPVSTSEDGKRAEFILLSLSAEKSQGTASSTPANQETDPGGRFFWVLTIELELEKGVAERKGIGKVRRNALASALDPGISWKEITLA
ncbi:heterokaryon incompatibility protein-domain-containing protein [Xylaria sp. FL1042]|nr:heterokaryon incompatibility protein-domain-containing protein [Xylaria sp. FL1042]